MPSIANTKGARRYAQKVGQNIRHIQAQWPGVPILFIGPSDMGEGLSTYPGLQFTVTALRDTVLPTTPFIGTCKLSWVVLAR